MTSVMHIASKIILLLFILQIIFAVENVSNAAWWDDIISSADGFLEKGKNAAGSGTITSTQQDGSRNTLNINVASDLELRTTINSLFNILFPLGIAVTVIMGGALGIKFMTASAEDKAKVKESLVPYIAGCIVIYGAIGIWKLTISIFSVLD